MAAQSENSAPLSVRSRGNRRAKALGAALSSMSSADSVDAAVLSGISSTSWNLNALRYNVSRHRRSDLSPITVSISQAAARFSSGSPMNAENERAPPCAVALGGSARERGL